MWRWICLSLKHVEELPCPFQIPILLPVMKKIKIELELDAKAVRKIEKLAEQDIKTLLEDEINNVDAFIDTMGYDNW